MSARGDAKRLLRQTGCAAAVLRDGGGGHPKVLVDRRLVTVVRPPRATGASNDLAASRRGNAGLEL